MDDEMFQASMPTLSADEIEDELQYAHLFNIVMPLTDNNGQGQLETMRAYIEMQAEQIRQLQRAWSSLVATAFVNNPEGFDELKKRIKANWRY